MTADQLKVLLMIVEALDQLKIPYLIGGSFASSAHGFARSTRDIDIVAAIEPEMAEAFAASLQSEFYADEQAIRRAVRAKQHFNVIHLDSMFKVDFFVLKEREFDRKQFERRLQAAVEGDPHRKVYVATPEDTILAKLVWYRKGNEISDQQWQDIRGIFKVQGDKLDAQYLSHWAEDLGVADLLERAQKES